MSVRNLQKLFAPRSIAVVGATDRAQSVGSTVMRNLIRSGYTGPVMPVNPKYDLVAGRKAFHRIRDLPVSPDLAILCTPPTTIPTLIAELGEIGTKAAIVLTAGLALETVADGRTLEQAMLDAAKPHLLRILGPNCVGLIVPEYGLNASFANVDALPGQIAFVSQSGALTTAVLDWATTNNIGFSKFISVGNSSDVDFGDALNYLASDASTRSILLYIESVKFARKFMSAARAASRNKPVIVVKAGRSAAGAAAAASHTGAMAGSDIVYDAAIIRAGMLRVRTTQDLFSAMETLSRAKPLRGERLIIVTNGGGPGVMAADALGASGERLSELTPQTRAALNEVLPTTWSRNNPIDIIGDAPPERYSDALSVLLDKEPDSPVLFIHAPTAVASGEQIASACAPLINKFSSNVFACWLGGATLRKAREIFNELGVPTYQTPEEAVQAFVHLLKYRRNQELLLEAPSSQSGDFSPDTAKLRAIVRSALDSGACMLSDHDCGELLRAYSIPVVSTFSVATPEEAASKANEIGYPVVLKILSPDISHKSDVGGVALDLRNEQHVLEAGRQMLARVSGIRPGASIAGFTIQSMIRRPHAFELIIGVAEDALFGPVILFGHGGTATEIISDRAIGLPPLNKTLARDLVSRTRIARLLEGYRDQPAVDIDALCLTLEKLSQIVIDIPELVELDINPLLVDSSGVLALDARVRVQTALLPGASRCAIRPYPKELEKKMSPPWERYLLRPIRPSDLSLYRKFLKALAPEDMRSRFFGYLSELPNSEVARFTQIDYEREMSLLIVGPTPSEPDEILGEVRLVADPDNYQTEMGIVVRSDVKQHGLGSTLLSAAIEYCRARGTREMVGTVLSSNLPMLQLAKEHHFTISTPRSGVVEISLQLNRSE